MNVAMGAKSELAMSSTPQPIKRAHALSPVLHEPALGTPLKVDPEVLDERGVVGPREHLRGSACRPEKANGSRGASPAAEGHATHWDSAAAAAPSPPFG
eukprot:4399948-Pyramimonas_sp.AAC.1